MITIPLTFYFDKTAAKVVATVRKAHLVPDNTGGQRVMLDDYDVHYADGTPVSTELLDEHGHLTDEMETAFETVLSL